MIFDCSQEYIDVRVRGETINYSIASGEDSFDVPQWSSSLRSMDSWSGRVGVRKFWDIQDLVTPRHIDDDDLGTVFINGGKEDASRVAYRTVLNLAI